jgi:hypothetical protein
LVPSDAATGTCRPHPAASASPPALVTATDLGATTPMLLDATDPSWTSPLASSEGDTPSHPSVLLPCQFEQNLVKFERNLQECERNLNEICEL